MPHFNDKVEIMYDPHVEDRQNATVRPAAAGPPNAVPVAAAAPSIETASKAVATDVEAQHQPDNKPTAIPEGTSSQPLESAESPDDQMSSQLESLEAPYFKPYWSPDFFITGIGAILMIWAFCWLYIGAFWNPLTRLGNLHVTVLNCDVVPLASSLNATFAALLPQLAPVPLATGLLAVSIWNISNPLYDKLRWENGTCPGTSSTAVPGVGICGTPEQEAACLASYSNDVLQGGAWAILYFPSSFTSSYLSWFSGSGTPKQNQRPVSQYLFARGRDYSTCSYLGAIIANTLIPGLSSSLTWGLANNPGVMQALSPGFLATGISLQQVDLAPVHNFGQHFATYIFCVLLWLGSSFVVVSSYQFKLPSEALLLDPKNHLQAKDKAVEVDSTASSATTTTNNNNRHHGQQVVPLRLVRLSQVVRAVVVKALLASVFMFILVVLLCVVLFALGRGNEQWHFNPGYALAFGWYMSWSFTSINAVLLHAIGIERFSSISALLLILQLTSASGILSVDLSNRFFYIGKGLPFFYGVRGFRTIFFGALQDKMYINWLVLTAYNVLFAPLGVLLVVHRVWSAPSRDVKQQPGGSAAGVGEVVLPVAVAGTG